MTFMLFKAAKCHQMKNGKSCRSQYQYILLYTAKYLHLLLIFILPISLFLFTILLLLYHLPLVTTALKLAKNS